MMWYKHGYKTPIHRVSGQHTCQLPTASYSCTNLAAHLEGVSHDAVSDYLARATTIARQWWELVAPLLNDTERAYLVVGTGSSTGIYQVKADLFSGYLRAQLHNP